MVLTLAAISNPQEVWGARVSVKELNDRLFSAVFYNNLALVRSSITAGANIKATNNEGLTAAGLAVEKGYFSIAHYILGVINQKSATKKDNTNIFSEKLNKNSIRDTTTKPNGKKLQISIPTMVYSPSKNLTSQTYKQWPINKPNPFSPDTPPQKALPIIGTIQKSSVKPEIPSQAINLKIKVQKSNSAPLKTPNFKIVRETQAPKSIHPLNKKLVNKTTPEKARRLKSKPATVDQKKEQVDGFIENTALEEVIGAMWNKITKIF